MPAHPQLLAAGGALASYAVALALRGGVKRPGGRDGVTAALGRLYARSGPGRRLRQRLDRACITLEPAQWRLAQLAAVAPLVAALLLCGLPVSTVLALALTAARLAAATLLWSRRDRLRQARSEAAPRLARLLGSELGTGAGAGQALESALLAAPPEPLLRALLASAAAGLHAGRPGGDALEAAAGVVRDPDGAVCNPDELSAVAACFGRQAEHGASAAAGLWRLAEAFEEAARTTAAVRATTSEARVVAFSVPAVGLAAAVALGTAAPGSWHFLLSLPGLVSAAVCVGAVAAGEVIVCRLTRA